MQCLHDRLSPKQAVDILFAIIARESEQWIEKLSEPLFEFWYVCICPKGLNGPNRIALLQCFKDRLFDG